LLTSFGFYFDAICPYKPTTIFGESWNFLSRKEKDFFRLLNTYNSKFRRKEVFLTFLNLQEKTKRRLFPIKKITFSVICQIYLIGIETGFEESPDLFELCATT
jgi:hypothetical protein